MPRTRAQRRHHNVHKALRKRGIVRSWGWDVEYYDNLHQYSKNKIHCSCPMCAAKTNPKRKRIGRGYTGKDLKRIEEMNYEENDYE